MDCSMPGLPVHHHLLEFTQTHVHWVSDAIQPNLILCRPLLLLPSIFPSIRVFSMSQFFSSGGQSIGVSASASVLPINTQDWSPLGWTGWLSLQSKGLSRVFSNIISKASVLQRSALFMVQLSHPYMTTGKTITLAIWNFVCKVMSLLFNMLSRLVIAFLTRSKCFLISWIQSPSDFGAQENKVSHIVSPSICHEVMGPDVIILVFWMLSFRLLRKLRR